MIDAVQIARDAVIARTAGAPWVRAEFGAQRFRQFTADVHAGKFDWFGEVRDAILGAKAMLAAVQPDQPKAATPDAPERGIELEPLDFFPVEDAAE